MKIVWTNAVAAYINTAGMIPNQQQWLRLAIFEINKMEIAKRKMVRKSYILCMCNVYT